MINLACIVITDDMDTDAIVQALDEPASVVMDARLKPVTETVPELIGIHYAKRYNTAAVPKGRHRPGAIEITDK